MKNTIIEVTMTFTTRMELDPQLYDGIKDIEKMIAIEQENFSNRDWVIEDYLSCNDDPEYSFEIVKLEG